MGRKQPRGRTTRGAKLPATGPPAGNPPGQTPAESPAPAPAATLSSRHARTLREVFERPTRSDIPWRSIEALIVALGGEVEQGRGSRRRFAVRGLRATFHEPHPERVTDKGAVDDIREFLERAGIEP